MNDFERQLGRLKAALHLEEDQQVAELLGLSKAALSQRKGRNAFPADRLRLLAAAKPELRLDIDFVLTGASGVKMLIEAKEPPAGYGGVVPLDLDLYRRAVEMITAELAKRGASLPDAVRSSLAHAVHSTWLASGKSAEAVVRALVDLALDSHAAGLESSKG